MGSGHNFELVFVCTGNRFRSPLAAELLRVCLAPLSVAIDVRSVGVLDVGAQSALPEAIALGQRHGVDLRSHVSRVLERGSLASTDLVIGFELHHVATAVIEGGAPRERVFTLEDLVDLLDRIKPGRPGDPTLRAQDVLERVAALRPTHHPLTIQELADPLGLPRSEAEAIADRVATLVRRLAHDLFRV